MADTTFVNNTTVSDQDWFNDLNRLHYTIFGDPAAVINAVDALHTKGSSVASAATINLTSATGDYVHITGTTTITAITLGVGAERTLIFDGALTLTHNATSLILPGGTNITTAAGDSAIFRGDSAGNVKCVSYVCAQGGTSIPVAVVQAYAGSSAPSGWLLCYGQAVSRTTYANLFAVVSTTYGTGDGSTTFNLPDLRGRAVFGVDNMGGSAASRVTNGNSGITGTTLGAAGGSELLHAHTHTATVTDPGHHHTYDEGGAGGTANGYTGGGIHDPSAATSTTTTGVTVSNANAGTGSSQNMPPALMLNYLIRF